jgi:antitoxin component of MazEF toxin-antitoxin module
MRKKLSAVGNSLGIVIEKPILELLNIDRDTELEVTTDGNRLVLEPVRKEAKDRKKRISGVHQKVMGQHDATFRKLAK